MPFQHPRARDEGLRKVSTITRWALAGGAGLTGVFSVLAASSYSGRSTSTPGSASGASTGATATPGQGSASSGTLLPPSTPVYPASGPAAATSGGS